MESNDTNSTDQPESTDLREFDDLTVLSVFDRVDLDKMLELATSSEEFRQIIAEKYMIPLFQDQAKILSIGGNPEQMQEQLPNASDDKITIFKSITAGRLLRFYGNLVTRLELTTAYFTPNETTKISQHIGQFCANSLVELKLKAADKYFPHSEPIHFPNVKRFQVEAFAYFPMETIDFSFEQLEEIRFDTTGHDEWPAVFIGQNGDLKVISLSMVSLNRGIYFLEQVKQQDDLKEIEIELSGDSELEMLWILKYFNGLEKITAHVDDWPTKQNPSMEMIQTKWPNSIVHVKSKRVTKERVVTIIRPSNN